MKTSEKWLFAAWAALTVVAGSVLTSFHQPFRSPSAAILRLARPEATRTRALHLLSSSCVCSQGVMRHLIDRKPIEGLAEQIVLLDGPAPGLPGTDALVASLLRAGFAVRRIPAAAVPPEAALRGVPLLLFAAPDDSLLYIGGYGPAYAQDSAIFQQLRHRQKVEPLAVIGCAVGQRLRRLADPFHLKD